MKTLDTLVDGITARRQLSPKGDPDQPMGETRFSAIKRAMGITARHVSVAAIRKWLHANPNFSEAQIYQRKNPRARAAVFEVGKIISLHHGKWVYHFRVAELGADGKPTRLEHVTR